MDNYDIFNEGHVVINSIMILMILICIYKHFSLLKLAMICLIGSIQQFTKNVIIYVMLP